MTNKFYLPWQIVRTAVRKLKTPIDKITTVVRYLFEEPSISNYDRVINWLNMTKLGYTSGERVLFDNTIKSLEEIKNSFETSGVVDKQINLKDYSTKDIEDVLKDLNKRTYGFQFGQTPKAHIKFVEELSKELARRNRNEN